MLRLALRDPDETPELLRRFQLQRDHDALGELIRRHGPMVQRYCRRRLQQSDADDAFQAVFLILALKAESIREPEALTSWLLGTSRRVIRQIVRRRPLEPLPTDVILPERDRAEFWLDEELARLPEKLRNVVVLCLVEERTQLDAAARLGISERTLRRRLDAGKHRLREQLSRRGFAPAVVLALLTQLNAGQATIPESLHQATLQTIFHYLIGSTPLTAPALLATGVLTLMTKKLITLTVVTLALSASVVGIGLTQSGGPPGAAAGGGPPATPPVPTTKVEPATTPNLSPPMATDKGKWVSPLLLECEIPAYRRALQNELNYQYLLQSDAYTGGTIREGEEAAMKVIYSPNEIPKAVSTELFDVLASYGMICRVDLTKPVAGQPRQPVYLRMSNNFDIALFVSSENFAIRHLLAAYCQQSRQLPDWVDLYLMSPSGSRGNGRAAAENMFASLGRGEAYRLRKVFSSLTDTSGRGRYGAYSVMTHVSTVWEFLHDRRTPMNPALKLHVMNPKGEKVLLPYAEIEVGTELSKSTYSDRRRLMAFAEFLRLGMANDGGWDKAASDVYGYKDVNEMEQAWIKWVVAQSNNEELPKPVLLDEDKIPPIGGFGPPSAMPGGARGGFPPATKKPE